MRGFGTRLGGLERCTIVGLVCCLAGSVGCTPSAPPAAASPESENLAEGPRESGPNVEPSPGVSTSAHDQSETPPHDPHGGSAGAHHHGHHDAAEPALAIFDRDALQLLEARGLDFARYALGLSEAAASTQSYAKNPRFSTIVKTVRADLREFAARDSNAGVGMRYAHRLFDATWLDSPRHRFELAAVVNRVDRKVFAPSTCGEVRFIYRLAYDAQVKEQRVQSRLPMTVNVVHWLPGGDCVATLQAWRLPERGGPAAAQALTGSTGPLGDAARAQLKLKSIEINLQSVRWPSTVRPNMAGHAEYVLRVFEPDSKGGLAPASLENTPDADKLRRSPALKREFLAWLGTEEALRATDLGTVLIPERFLATRAISVAPHGLARLGNRPFSGWLSNGDLSSLSVFSGGNFKARSFNSPEELRRRLDGLTCNGCHQSRSVAGFHVLGRDAQERRADALAMPHSPHFTDEMKRRSRYAAALLAGTVPDERREAAERPLADNGYGAHCGLKGAAGPSTHFSNWDCADGFTCVRVNEAEVGQCMPKEPEVGDVCQGGAMRPHASPRRDFVALASAGDCGGPGVCERNGVGFPGGMCSRSCNNLDSTATCGAIAELRGFNDCLARSTPFEDCILNNTRPGALRRCSHAAPCREDYVCAQMPNGEGACIPPYFLFQLRVDGHPL